MTGGSDIDWFDSCNGDHDCRDGLSCFCGVCTLRCNDDATCARAGGGLCVTPPTCSDGNSARICLATCSDSWDCPGSSSCDEEKGYCGDFEDYDDWYEPPLEDAAQQDASNDASSSIDATIEDATIEDATIEDATIEDATIEDDDATFPSDDDAG